MHPLMLGGALGLGLGLLLVPPASAQNERSTHVSETVAGGRQRVHMIQTDDHRSLSVMLDGNVHFTDDDADVAAMDDGATLVIDEHPRGEPSRHLSLRGEDGAIRRTYTVGGVSGEHETDRKAWLARILPDLIREQALNAGPRVERILRREGPDGVLREIGRIRSDGSRRVYLLLLLKEATLTPAQQAAAFRVTERIGSDGAKSAVLRAFAPSVDLSHGPARERYFEAASSISSDGSRRSVLLAILSRAAGEGDALTALLASAGEISSDGEKSNVLIAAAGAPALDAPSARDAWFRAAGTISSDGSRSRALRALLAERGEYAVHALRSARGISSDGEKARVLLAVSPERLRDAPVAEAYAAALESISSNGERRRAEQHARAAEAARR